MFGIGKFVKSLIRKSTMWPVGWGIVIGLFFCAGYFYGGNVLKVINVKYEHCLRERYVVMPERITDTWLKDCLSRVPDVRVQVSSPGSLRFFCCHSQVMGFINYDQDEQMFTFVTGVKVKHNQYLYEIANYRNLAVNFQRLCFDEEKEFLSLTMDLDVAAGVTAKQVEHFCLIFIEGVEEFHNNIME